MIAAGMLWAWVIATAPPAAPRPEPTLRPGWLQLSPLGVAVPGPGKNAELRGFDRAVIAGYRWGLNLGIAMQPVDHLLLELGGALGQSIWLFDNRRGYELCFRGDCYGWTERGLGQLLELGAQLRVGWIDRRFLAWAKFGAGVGLSRVRLDCDNSVEEHCDRSELDLGPSLAGGLGAALRIYPSFALGLESSVEQVWADDREDPFRVLRSWDLALVVIVNF